MKLSIEKLPGGYLVETPGSRNIVPDGGIGEMLENLERLMPEVMDVARTRDATNHWFRITLQVLAQPLFDAKSGDAAASQLQQEIADQTGITPLSVTYSEGATVGPAFHVVVEDERFRRFFALRPAVDPTQLIQGA